MSHDERPVEQDDAAPAEDPAPTTSPTAADEEAPGQPALDQAAPSGDAESPRTSPAQDAPEKPAVDAPRAPEPDVAPEVDVAPEPEEAAEADATPGVDATPETDAAATAEPDDVAEAAPVTVADAPVEAEPVTETDVTPEPEADATAEAAPESVVEGGTTAEAEPEAEATAQAEPEAEPAAEAESDAPQAGSPAAPAPAAPRPRPVPRPLARPAVPSPAAVAPTASAPTAPVPPALTAAETAEAARWGRVDDDGTVWVREESGERVVGQYPDADPTEALAFYVRRYADLHAKVVLFEARLAATDLSVKEIDSTLTNLAAEVAEPAAVGDLSALRARLEALRAVAAERRAAAEAERAAAREAAVAERTALVEAAEKIAATDPERMQWRPAGEQLRVLLDRWKDSQRHGPRLDRGTEDALWKRFSHARSAFDRERRRWFSDLEKRNAGAKSEKEALVAEAERLSSSTDWGATSAAYRDLMTRWKNAGRASRKDDDALWSRFRAAQDVFFAARDATQRQTDEEYSANLEVKLGLLAEAEKLVPVTDLGAAKAALRDLQERWERAGKVPRADVQRVEGRLRAVEQAVRDADQAQWRRTNPETRARAEGAAAQLYAAIAALESDLDAAKATGDARKVAEAQAALDARRSWLEQVERAAQEARG